MEIRINDATIQEALNEKALKSFQNVLESWDVQQAIGEMITKEVAVGAIGKALEKALSQIDTVSMTNRLAEELQRAAISATIHILQEGLLSTVAKLYNLSDYTDADKKAKERLRARLFEGAPGK